MFDRVQRPDQNAYVRKLQQENEAAQKKQKTKLNPDFFKYTPNFGNTDSDTTQKKEAKESSQDNAANTDSKSKTNIPKDIQSNMEQSFGTSFNDVNIHTNDKSATDLGALAYTQGKDVHFAPGQFNPNSKKGQELIGHELTHVVQQKEGRVKSPNIGDMKPTIPQKSERQLKREELDKDYRASKKGPAAQMQFQLKYNKDSVASLYNQKHFAKYVKNGLMQLKRNKHAAHAFRAKSNAFQRQLQRDNISFNSEEYIQRAKDFFPDFDPVSPLLKADPNFQVNENKALEHEADVMGKRAAEGKNSDIQNRNTPQTIMKKEEDKPKEEGKENNNKEEKKSTSDPILGAIYDELNSWSPDTKKILNILNKFKSSPESISKLKDLYRKCFEISLEAHVIAETTKEENGEILNILSNDTGKLTVGLESEHIIASTKQFKKANSFTELVMLVRIAEDLLIKAGHTNMEDRIKILRGIYYGTNWSMDFQGEGSETRNLGFDVYTGTTKRPINPRTILGESLFQALIQSPEVKDGSRAVDFGHLIIGLDSRTSYIARKTSLPMQGGSGLEAVTWLGDIGGGVGMVSIRRITAPNTKSKPIVFNSTGHDYGALINVEGDVAAYAVANDSKSSIGFPDIKEYGYISDALADYLLMQDKKPSKSWNSRVVNFTQMLGGEVESGKIKNKLSLIKEMSVKLADFGGMYALTRLKDQGRATEANYRSASTHILGAALETALVFIDMLEKNINGTSKKLVATYDPKPSSPGKEYGVLKQAANSIKLGNRLNEQINEQIDKWQR